MILFELTGNKGEGVYKQCLNLIDSVQANQAVHRILIIDTVCEMPHLPHISNLPIAYRAGRFDSVVDVRNVEDFKDILRAPTSVRTTCVRTSPFMKQEDIKSIIHERQKEIQKVDCRAQEIAIVLYWSV